MAAPATSGSREIVRGQRGDRARLGRGVPRGRERRCRSTTTIGVGTPAPTRVATRCRPRADSIDAGIALVEAGVTEKSARPDAHAPSRTRAPARAARGRPVTARAARAQNPARGVGGEEAARADRAQAPALAEQRQQRRLQGQGGARSRAAGRRSRRGRGAQQRHRGDEQGARTPRARPRPTTATVRPAWSIAATERVLGVARDLDAVPVDHEQRVVDARPSPMSSTTLGT